MIIHTDILKWCEEYDGEPFHALLCDPPYHLTEIVKRFGGADSAPAQYGHDGAFQRASRGFMGKQWDGGDIAFRPETWAALARHLHPGAFGMAFASTKGYHRMACAIEDAGLIIHPMIVYAFGSGFPKATRIDTQIDRRAGAERRVVGKRKHQPKFDAKGHGYREKDNGFNSKDRATFDLTAPATDLAAAWEGHRYGGQILKPALEPICVFRKPYQGRPVDCIARTGAGTLNIESGRIGSERVGWGGAGACGAVFNGATSGLSKAGDPRPVEGRWPANLILDEHAAAALDAQSGVSESKRSQRGQINVGRMAGGSSTGGVSTERGHDDSGGAARYFQQCDWTYEIEERIAAADPVRYCAKASKSEREAGLDPLQIRLSGMMEIEPPQRTGRQVYGQFAEDFPETTVDDGRPTPIDNAYLRGETRRRNTHPTIKPISLTRYLATLLLPPDAYAPRRILIPFSGAGSEVIGADLAGWEAVIGVELEAQHVAIAQARRAFWRALRYRLLDPSADLSVSFDQTDRPTLFDLLNEEAA